jgi:hypothetical protein
LAQVAAYNDEPAFATVAVDALEAHLQALLSLLKSQTCLIVPSTSLVPQ